MSLDQNDYEEDERPACPFMRRHNRLEFGTIVVKSITIVNDVASSPGPLRAWVNLCAFIFLFLLHFFTQAFWLEHVNRLFNG